jgi:putative methionine-R-sulfoxide reductase with GAF domain
MVRPALKALLTEACQKLKITKAFIGYVEEDDIVSIDPELWMGRSSFPVRVLSTSEGLCGLAIQKNLVHAYPLDPEAREHIVLVGDEKLKTIGEIAGPLRYGDEVTGVVLVHSSDPNRPFDAASKKLFRNYLAKMNDEVRAAEETRKTARTQLTRIAEDCCRAIPMTRRGYVAVKDWDGRLAYFYTPSEAAPFLNLDQWEGLCGEVLSTGRPIVAGNVFEHPAYKPSDPDIRSEIVYPIFDGEETIGVVNLESTEKDAFEDSEERVRNAADDALKWANEFRQPPSDHFGYVLGDYVGSVAGLLESDAHKAIDDLVSDVNGKIIDLLRRKGSKAIGGRRSEWWPKEERPPFAGERAAVPYAEGILHGGFDGPDQRFTIHAQVIVSGKPYGTIGIEKDRYRAEDSHVLQSFCRATAFFLQHGDRSHRLRTSIRLLRRLTLESFGGMVEETVDRLRLIVGGESCTLFFKTRVLDRDVFVPGPTTVRNQVFRARALQDGDPWYESDPESGLTAWVASTGRSLRIKDIKDTVELGKIDRQLRWGKWLAEEGESRSYLACPVFEPGQPETPEHVIGVLRTHRAEASVHSGFSEDDLETLRTIARLLARPLFNIVTA